MRVVHVVTQVGTYGGERFVPALVRAQRAAGIDASIVTLYDSPTGDEELPMMSAGRGRSLGFFFRLVRIIREERPDIVHTHLAHGKTWGRLAATAAGCTSIVHTEHANDFGGSRSYRRLGRLLHARTARIVALSHAHAARIAELEGVAPERIAMIPNGIERSDAPMHDRKSLRRRYGIAEGQRLILFVGRLDRVKDPVRALESIALLAGHPDAQLWFAGDGPLHDSVATRARQLGVAQRVRLLGYRNDVSELLAIADAVVNTSSTEAMPLSLIEALCDGVPVVSTPWPGADELLGEHGYVSESHSAQAVAAMLARALEAPRASEAQTRQLQARFSIDRAAAAHERLYTAILSNCEVPMNDDERKSREKRLQDERFSNGGCRGAVDRAYAITGASHGYYKSKLAQDAPGKRLLEIGCGLGESALELSRAGGLVTGIDLSDVAVLAAREKARERHLNARFEAMDAEATGFPNQSFDVICGGAILHHLDTERAYREIARLLAPDGYALFVEPLGYNPFINLYRRLTPAIRTPDEHPLLERDLELSRRFFQDARIRYYYLTTLLLLPIARTRIGKALVNAANAVDRALFRVIPALRRQAWFIVLELRAPIAQG